ncbi:MAG: exo-alpha-sialidase [Ignavibacteriales bacterium]|nr:exo-alpha-sialidase [Ignavibacteriales bacterium]
MFHVVKRFQNKLILITVSAFIFLFTDVSAQKEWYYRCSTKFDNVVSFSVVDSLYMYVADRKGLHKSTDGGYTWTKLISASYYSAQVIFRSRNNGLLVTSGPITGTQSNGFPITLARTYDGGATWEWRSTHLYPGVLQWIDQVDSTIWGFGSILTQGYPAPVMGTLVAHSTNDGVTWITDSTYVNYTKWTGLVVMRPNVVIALALDRILKVSTDGEIILFIIIIQGIYIL